MVYNWKWLILPKVWLDQLNSLLIQNWGHIQVRHLNWEMGLDSLRLCHSHLSTFEPCNLKMMTAPHQSQFSNWNFPANIRSTTKSHLKHSVRKCRFDKIKVYVIYNQSIFYNTICIAAPGHLISHHIIQMRCWWREQDN